MSQSEKIRNKYPDRIPIIVSRIKNSEIPLIDKNKYLAPKDMMMNQFIYVIRKRIKLKPEQAIFIIVNNELCESNKTLEQIYLKCKNIDGFLYMEYSGENTFG